ncbi:MAG: Rne/Rng family ribonuclease, partial [Myxococcaceae bacterium]
ALGRDKAKTNVLRISELGLVEMTRKRVRESIGRVLHEDCAYCEGQGFVKTATTVCYEIFRAIRREGPGYKDPTLVVNCHGDVARLLQNDERNELRHLMDRYNKSIQIKAQQNYHREQYDIYGRTATGSDHKLAGSFGHTTSNDGFGAPKHRDQPSERGGGGGGGNRDRDRNGGRRDRGRDRDRSGNRDGERNGNREGGNRDAREGERGNREGGNRDAREGERGNRDRGSRDGQSGRGPRQDSGRREGTPGEGKVAVPAESARVEAAPSGAEVAAAATLPPKFDPS